MADSKSHNCIYTRLAINELFQVFLTITGHFWQSDMYIDVTSDQNVVLLYFFYQMRWKDTSAFCFPYNEKVPCCKLISSSLLFYSCPVDY